MNQRMQNLSGQQDLYESIQSARSDSQTNFRETDNQERKFQVSRQIVFPLGPQHFAHLFSIYQRNAHKMSQLNSQVNSLQQTILEQLRVKSLKQGSEIFVVDDFEEFQLDDDPIVKFDQLRKHRQNSIAQLNELYETLNRINKVEWFLMKKENQGRMMEKIRETKEVISYSAHSTHLTAVTRHRPPNQHISKQMQPISIEESGIFLQEDKQEECYTIAVMETRGLRLWLSPTAAKLQLEQGNTLDKLHKSKEEAEQFCNLSRRVSINGGYRVTTAAYSDKYKLLFVYDVTCRIQVYDMAGTGLSRVQLDELQVLLFMEEVGGQLLVGTGEGVVRVFQVTASGQLRIARVIVCSYGDHQAVEAYCLVGTSKIDKIMFLSGSNICEFDLNTNIASLLDTIDEQLLSFINRTDSLSTPLKQAVLKKQLGKQFIRTVMANLNTLQPPQNNSQLIKAFYDQAQNDKPPNYQLLFADSEGSLSLCTL